jgi:hypothetical protein
MKIKKLIIVSTLLTSLNVIANDEINYSWVEVNYHWNEGDVFSLDGSFEITDNLYISTDVSRVDRRGGVIGGGDKFAYTDNSYGLALGRHKSITSNTDLYAVLGQKI